MAIEERVDPILTYAFAREHGVVVLGAGERMRVGMRDGADPKALLEARRALGAPFDLERLSPSQFDSHLSEAYADSGLDSDSLDAALDGQEELASLADGLPPTADLLDSDDHAPVIRLLNAMIAEAVRSKASDIHIEPYEDRLSVRFRVDGVLREVLRLQSRLAPLLVSRVKVMARLDIAEKRVPQDGRVSLSLGGHAVDVRVSTLPSRYGERVVLRLLDKEHVRLDLADLGMPDETRAPFERALAQPNGIILVTGPTGSGKTTTLYAALTLLNDGARNILTVEDPVEYGLDGIGQTQVNSKVGMTFASGLRAILRQDPDVLMVGEVRDSETVQIAVQASLTGHLVLSTVHTNSALAAITRLRDMGVESFLLASTISAILAQRLVRKLCEHCKEAYEPDAAELAMLGVSGRSPGPLYRAKGCPHCSNLGYDGRLGLYELVIVDDRLRSLIHDDAREQDMSAHAFQHTESLLQCGARQAFAGLTSSAEVLRACRHSGDGDGGV